MTDWPARLQDAIADLYRLERELGRGGMATVYLADDLRHGRKVAIKVMRADTAEAIGHDRFLREIEIAARPARRSRWRSASLQRMFRSAHSTPEMPLLGRSAAGATQSSL